MCVCVARLFYRILVESSVNLFSVPASSKCFIQHGLEAAEREFLPPTPLAVICDGATEKHHIYLNKSSSIYTETLPLTAAQMESLTFGISFPKSTKAGSVNVLKRDK